MSTLTASPVQKIVDDPITRRAKIVNTGDMRIVLSVNYSPEGTVGELIEALKEFDKDQVVTIKSGDSGGGYYSVSDAIIVLKKD